MSNLTITIDDATLKKARLRALTEGISVNEVLRNFLESYAGVGAEQAAALDDLMDLSRRAKSRNARAKRWSREDLHERS
jgi:plasmid stability protein